MNCRSCRHSEMKLLSSNRGDGRFAAADVMFSAMKLWCQLDDRQAVKACSRFEYEPGTDAAEVVTKR